MSLKDFKMRSLGDKIQEKAIVPETEIVPTGETEVEIKVKKGRRLNK